MRAATAPEIALLDGTTYWTAKRFRVANGSGTLIDLSSWVITWDLDDDIDRPVKTLALTLQRGSGATVSLVPLRTDSTLNRLDDGVTYSPLLDAGRLFVFETQSVAHAGTANPASWREEFRGYLDEIDAGGSVVSIFGRDEGGVLQDRWIETEGLYGYAQPVETVMQQLLDDTLGAGVVTLVVEGSPTMDIPTGTVESQPLMEALTTWAQDMAWDVRYKWNEAAGAFRLTLYEPPRSNTTPDRTWGPSTYYEVSRLVIGREGVRNAFHLSYPDGTSTGPRAELTAEDATSIARYGRRFMGITEGSDSPIDTVTEATNLLDGIKHDLKDPKAEFEIEAQYFWRGELHDLYRFSANAVHFNTNQDWAVTNRRQSGTSNGSARTYLKVRGTPAGGYLSWRRRAEPAPDPQDTTPWIEIDEAIDLAVAKDTEAQRREEEKVRAGQGGLLFPGQAYDTKPWYDDTGATLLVNPSTRRITGDLGYVDGTGINALKPAEAGAEVTTGKSITVMADRLAANINWAAGGSVEGLKPAQAGADVTGSNTAADTAAVDGRPAATVKTEAIAGKLAADDLTAFDTGGWIDLTGHEILETKFVDGTAAATVKGGAVKANTGLDGSGAIQVAAPRIHAIANVPGLDLSSGKVDKGTAYDTGEAQAGSRDVARGAGSGVASGSREELVRGGATAGVAFPGQQYGTQPIYDLAGETIIVDPTTRYVTPKKIIGGGPTPTLSGLHADWDSASIAGTDTAGKVTFTQDTPGTLTAGGQHVTVTFTTAYATAPNVVVSFEGTANPGVSVNNVTTTSFRIWFQNSVSIGGIAVTNVNYLVIG